MLSNDRLSRRPSAEKQPGPTCIITMVHGTWGRGFFPKDYRARMRPWLFKWLPAARPPWFHEGSIFRSRLETELRKGNITATLRIFLWSGANSVVHRAHAADELNRLLASDPDDANSVVIAHSHGGNVAYRAISKMGSRGARINLITLATPFLRVFPTWSGPSFLQLYITLFVATTLGVSIAMGAHLSEALWPEHLGFGKWVAEIVLPLAAICALLVRLVINPSPPPEKRRPDGQANRWARRPFILADETNYDSAGHHAPNLLVIRGVDDEASLALAFGGIATRINRLALGALWILVLAMPLVLTVVDVLEPPVLVWLFGKRHVLDPESRLWSDRALYQQVKEWLWLAAGVGAAMLVAVPALFNTRFGREFLVGVARCEVMTDSTPDSTPSRIVTLETPYQPFPWVQSEELSSTLRMRHRIYDYPSCVPEIVKWLNERFESHPR
jgi:hypothetical protein